MTLLIMCTALFFLPIPLPSSRGFYSFFLYYVMHKLRNMTIIKCKCFDCHLLIYIYISQIGCCCHSGIFVQSQLIKNSYYYAFFFQLFCYFRYNCCVHPSVFSYSFSRFLLFILSFQLSGEYVFPFSFFFLALPSSSLMSRTQSPHE